MESTKWNDKAGVLKDLEQVGTLSFGPQDDIRPVADKPSALNLQDDDDYHFEMEQIYGCENSTLCDEEMKPDLQNISRMLNMVQSCKVMPVFREPERCLNNNAIVISKLNPCVEEFTPRTHSNSSANSDTIPSKTSSEIVSTSDPISNDIHSHSLGDDISGKINQNRETEKTAALLKKTITENSKGNTIKTRTEKNVAIAALLKLYSTPPTTPSTTPSTTQPNSAEKSYKLLTPDDFKPKEAIKEDCSIEQNLEVHPKAIEMSIQKVDSWLMGPRKDPPKPLLSIGPITYKRKAKTNSSTPNSSHAASPAYSPSTKLFVNTDNELYEKLCEASKRVQLAQRANETIWDKAMREMKEREANAVKGKR